MALHFKVTTQTIANALNFRTSSEFAKRIRKYAVAKGGKVVEFKDEEEL
jgi:hypothetical protein